MSRDLTCSRELAMASGEPSTALDIQERYLELVKASFIERGEVPTPVEQLVLQIWESVITRMREDIFLVATEVEWVGKLALFNRQKERLGSSWADPRLAAMDLAWADLRPSKSLVAALDRAGLVKRLFTSEEVRIAADGAPPQTRAAARGEAVKTRPDLVAASWTSLVFDKPGVGEGGEYQRVPIGDPTRPELPRSVQGAN